MNKALAIILFFITCMLMYSCAKQSKKVLIFSKTEGFRHSSIESGTQALQDMLESNQIDVTTTEDTKYFTEDSLRQYAAVIFLNTTGDILNYIQQADFERYIQASGGFVGIHAASDTEFDWPWYNGLVGAYFDGHPAIQEANVSCIQRDDPCCQHLPEIWTISEEWYNFKSIYPEIDVLMTLDESSYEGGTNGERHPVVWRHDYDGGRSFYTALGHKEETFEDPLFLQQVKAGIEFAMARKKLDYTRASTLRIPEENRFTKRVLDFNLDEPMELDELGERGIIYIERRGAIKLYEYETEKIINLDTLAVHYDDEDGLLGLAVDPNFAINNWIFLFYSPDTHQSVQHVSRFTLLGDQLAEEKVLLEIPLIRECCHSGGSLEFGNDGLLYIGVGDNTNPFESSGYAPIDESANRQLYDAQRSAGNTNDLRGKILRIRPEEDGSYSIPPGNLFAEGTDNTRPEIYIMGCRNPFRFSIDTKNNYLYWGDVGPDAGETDSLRGPMGMGEMNQAKRAGFYGWPYSRGNNQMYIDYDFVKERSGIVFDPNQIINDSPNNTGIASLPPIQESMIWYSYRKSPEFPWLGSGGVNPMSGPIYYAANYNSTSTSLPAYFEHKWFVYEWMRDWIYVVHFDENEQYVQAVPFMPNTEFSHPMDMLFSKDGTLYILEYGQKWNTRNLDARLSTIHYNNGNRPPVAQFEMDKTVGAIPLQIHFSASQSYDYDADDLTYSWRMGKEIITTDTPDLTYEFQKAGMHHIELTVTDIEGNSSSVDKKIMAGNEPPKIAIQLDDQNTTYWKNRKLYYNIEVTDEEDGSTKNRSIDPSQVKVTFNYLPEGEDMILASIGHQQHVKPKGLKLINTSTCGACHAIEEIVSGPSFLDIAQRYDNKDKQTMMRRIIKGSHGVWGEEMMAPHPQLKLEEVEEMVDYILSLDPNKQMEEQQLPLEGYVTFNEHLQDNMAGKYVLMASYLDEGNPDVRSSSLSAVDEVVFIAPRLELENALFLDKELGVWQTQGRTVVGSIKDGKQIKFDPISFDNLTSVSIGAVFNKDYNYKGEIEIRQGNPKGTMLGSGVIQYYNKNRDGVKVFEIDLASSSGLDTLFLVFKNSVSQDQYTMNGDWIQLNYED